IRPGFPCGLFIVDLMGFGAGLCFHSPEPAAAIDVSAIGNEYQVRTIGRPHRADLRIELAVVVAGQRASSFTCEPLHVAEHTLCNVSHEYMKAAIVGCGYESDVLAVWRPARLCIDVAAAGDRLGVTSLQVQNMELVCIFVVRGVNDPTAIR